MVPLFHLCFIALVSRRYITSASTFTKSCTMSMNKDISYINSSIARKIDEALMEQPGFSIDQLMELAGLSVAQSAIIYTSDGKEEYLLNKKVLVLCGPGNNGGDGLVASRHLKHFGLEPSIYYPKPGKSTLFINLVKQCQDLLIPFHSSTEEVNQLISSNYYGLVIDSLFGFSFDGPPREPFAGLISGMSLTQTPVLSVDIPSGWHVEKGDIYSTSFNPSAVISLTLPKECMAGYNGVHFVGGR